jgi:hypothetical protein
VAVGLARREVSPVVLIDRAPTVGGVPSNYVPKEGGVPTFLVWTRARVMFGQDYARLLAGKLERTGTVRYLETQVLEADRSGRELTILSAQSGKQRIGADVIVLACGAREKSRAERGWIAGTRPARVFHTLEVLHLLDAREILPTHHPVVLGSDLVAFSAAAKLRAAGADEVTLADRRSRPAGGVAERLYFQRWCRPRWRAAEGAVQIEGELSAQSVRFDEIDSRECDGVLLSGELVPNSELAIGAGLEVEMPARVPVVGPESGLSEPGWFAAGNIIGGFHSAEWCYFNGLRVARVVARHLG